MPDKLPEVLIIVALFAYSAIATLGWLSSTIEARMLEKRSIRLWNRITVLETIAKDQEKELNYRHK